MSTRENIRLIARTPLVKDIMRNVSLKSCFEFEPAFFRGNVI